jgi:hypothetical protein
MKTRRTSLMALACAGVALGILVLPALAAELAGRIVAVDVTNNLITVLRKGAPERSVFKVDKNTVIEFGKGEERPLDLEKLKKRVEDSEKGVPAVVTYEDRTASKIRLGLRKDGDRKDDYDDDRKGDEPRPKRKRERPEP